jgi:hypothetical protein
MWTALISSELVHAPATSTRTKPAPLRLVNPHGIRKMTALSSLNLAGVFFLLCASVVAAQEGGDLRDLRIGMSINTIPADEYTDLRCTGTNDQTLVGRSDFRKCPPDAMGLRSMGFGFNEDLNPLAQVNDKYQGTKVAGHPVLLTLLISESGVIDGAAG